MRIFGLGLLGVAGPFGLVALAATVHYSLGEPWGQLTFAAPLVLFVIFVVGLALTDLLPADDVSAYKDDRKYGAER